MWAGNNTPDANAKFRVGTDGTLYATGATISGNITANSIAFGATYDGTSMTTIKSGAATGSTALQPNGTLTGNVSGTVGGVAVATVTAGAGRGNSAVQPGNGITVDATTKAINKIEASAGLPISTSGTRPVILDNLGLRMTNTAGTAYTVFLDASTGSAVFRGDITGASGTFSGSLSGASISGGSINIDGGSGTVANDADGNPVTVISTTSNAISTLYQRNGVASLGLNSVAFISVNTGGWQSSCYPYYDGAVDLGVKSGASYNTYRWRNLRLTGSAMFGGNGSTDTVGAAGGPLIRILSDGRIYANTLGTGTGNSIVQDAGYLRVQTSSIRYKENVNEINKLGYLDIINSLKPVTYNYIGDTGFNGQPRKLSGLIAEDLHEIPIMRTVVNYNEENQPDGIAYDRLTASLILAIQEVSDKIDSLSDRLDALER